VAAEQRAAKNRAETQLKRVGKAAAASTAQRKLDARRHWVERARALLKAL